MLVEFASREFVFKRCPQLAQHLMAYQQAMFNPLDDVYVEGDEVFLELDFETPTVLTEEQANQLNIEHAAYCMAMCDEFDGTPRKAAWFGSIIAELDAPTFEVFIENIGQSLVRLTSALGWDQVFVICDARHPYLAQENTYKPVRNATQNLLAMGMTRTSIEGAVLNENTISDFFESIFWIVRCNASAPGICFSSSNSNIIGTLCKHGNIHFECYSQAEREFLKEALKTSSFIEVASGICFENFSASGAIRGRQIIVE